LVIADLPGLIEGAHQGKGLGLRFLRHVERGAILLFILPLDWEDPWKAYDMLREELHAYDPRLLEKPLLIAFSKADLIPTEARAAYLRPEVPYPQVFISGATHEGLSELVTLLYETVKAHRGPTKSPVPWHP
jgi:GTP-binding protein